MILTFDQINDKLDFDKEEVYKNKREYICISEKTACRMAGGFLTTNVCSDVSANISACVL